MKPETSVRTEGLSRRSVLRRSAIVTAVGAFGVSSVTGTAAATDFCPRSPGYWHKHWKFEETVDIPPAGELSKSEIQNRLIAPTKGDKVNIMAKHYLATYLNLLLRPDPDDSCANKEVHVEGIGSVEWEHVKNSAQHWLRRHDWDGTEHTGTKDWGPKVDVEGADGTVNGEVLKDALDAFNNNRYEDLDCDCGEESSESDSSEDADSDEEGDGDEGGEPDTEDEGEGDGKKESENGKDDNGTDENGNSTSEKGEGKGEDNGNGDSKSGKDGSDTNGNKQQGRPEKSDKSNGKGQDGGKGKR